MENLIKEKTAAEKPPLRLSKRRVRPILTDPIFLLAPPRSFTSVVGTMLGQHPQLYGLPETHLFTAEVMADWWATCEEQKFPRSHGLLRIVAELFFDGQTEDTVRCAGGWLRRRSHLTTGMLLETIAARVHPRVLVDKSPSSVYSVKFMERLRSLFPRARFIHLMRNPVGHGESVMRFLEERRKQGTVPASHWLLHLLTYPDLSSNSQSERSKELDPQKGWFVLNQNIKEFLRPLPDQQKLSVRGEDLLQSPDEELRRIARWLEVRDDADAINEMKHPECSCYACFGPPNARYGNDDFFLESPALRPERAKARNLEGPVSWRQDGQGLLPEVKQLAREFGYE